MSLLREEPDFQDAIEAAANRVGLAAVFVEKDYWVTQVLRALADAYPGAFTFKGGTSLSKGYSLIERFSEDVDILVQPMRGDSAAVRERRLAAMSASVATALGLEQLEARAPGRGKHPHRADVFSYPKIVSGAINIAAEGRGVLLETGFAGGEWPCEMVTIEPLLCTVLELDPTEHADTAPFELRALKPVRTLIEKLALMHHLASRWPDSSDQRCGRHYYDIERLLTHAPTRQALKDRDEFDRILGQMQEIAAAHYGGWTARPPAGFADSPAFSPPRDSELRRWLEGRYNNAAELLPANANANWPTFGRVLKAVADSSTLL